MSRTRDPLTAYVCEQSETARSGLRALPDPDAVHRTRVALRRLRSTLRVFAPLLDLTPEDRRAADGELRWLTRVLGEVRDLQVQRARFAAALDELPPEQVLGPVRARIDDTLSAEQVRAQQVLGEALATERCGLLAALLQSWCESPPVRDSGAGGVRKRVRKAAKKAERRLAEACASGSDADLHRARKAAKRARYAAEVLRPLGDGGKRRKRFKRVQSVLGDHQDAVVAVATLRRIVSGVPAGESGFTLGLLHEREDRRAEELRSKACALARR